jgi:YaiO family outer membrane protein
MWRIMTFFIGLLWLGSTMAVAQDHMDELTVDELYERARTAVFDEEDYIKARKYAYKALDKSPNYHGIRIFVARTYGWEENYEKAREELHHVLKQDPDNRSAYLAITDIESWSENFEKALPLINRAIEYHPKDEELLLKKASVLYNRSDYEESEEVYEEILKHHPDNIKAREGLKAAQEKRLKYRAMLSYRHDQFTESFDPWRFTEFGLSRETSHGSIIGHIQYAQRFGISGTQFNLDAYPSITDGLYAYVSGGYSGSSIYPRYRFGLTLYKSFPASFELGTGYRYLDFASRQIDIFTGSISKYWGSYLFTFSYHFVPLSQNNLSSFNGMIRRYFRDENIYLSLIGGFGSTSTEIEFLQDIRTSESWSLGIEGQYPLYDNLYIGGNAEYKSDDYEHENFVRERFSFKMLVFYRF